MKAKLLNVAGTVIGECEQPVWDPGHPLTFETIANGTPDKVVVEVDIVSGRRSAFKGDTVMVEAGQMIGHG